MNRSCGECNACCVVPEINEGSFFKASFETCKHSINNRCKIWNESDKPITCTNYNCSWVRGYGEEEDRPDKSNIMLSICSFNGGTWIFAMETKPNASLSTGKNIIIDIANHIDLPIIVSLFESRPPNDKGDFVVLKKSLEDKARYIKGDFVFKLTKDITMYELIIH